MFRGTRRVSTSPDFSLIDVRTLSWKKLGLDDKLLLFFCVSLTMLHFVDGLPMGWLWIGWDESLHIRLYT